MQSNQVEKVVEVEQGVVGKWNHAGLATFFSVETTMPVATEQDRAKVLAIIECDSIKGQDVLGSELSLGDYIMHPIQLENPETGEVVDAIRTLLIQPDSDPVAFVSTGILKSIARIAWKENRTPPFRPPIRVKLVQKSTGRGRRTYKLIPVE